MSISSIVLAGGRSSRLGKEKHTEVIAGKSLIERTIDHLRPLSTEILIVISTRQSKSSFASYAGATTVVDLYPGKSSLGGIYTGVARSTSFHNLAVACDMPFLNPGLLRYMIGLSPDFDVVIPRIGDLEEPLHAIYSKNCLPPMEMLLKEGNLKVTGFFDSVKVRYVEKEEIDRFDPEHLSFFNINTQADLKRARVLATRADNYIETAD
ncbi:MAG TPA: molybdenum cofactor guanylyltransferase [Dehalococcoidia bacterium]|nr:molybdenum cofactor guanylyltransferase [Dehalococcoidia bacterium]